MQTGNRLNFMGGHQAKTVRIMEVNGGTEEKHTARDN